MIARDPHTVCGFEDAICILAKLVDCRPAVITRGNLVSVKICTGLSAALTWLRW